MSEKVMGQPVRSAKDGLDQTVIVKLTDGTTGTVNQMTVDADKNAHVEMHGNDPAGLDRVARMSETGGVQSDAVYDGATNTKPSTQGLIVQERNAAASDVRQTMRPTAKRGSVDTDVVCLDVAIRDEDGNKFTDQNPLPVYMAQDPGTEIHEPAFEADVVAGATTVQTYAIGVGTVFELHQVLASSSGLVTGVLELTLDGSTYSRLMALRNSVSNPTAEFAPKVPKSISGGAAVALRLTITNRDEEPFDIDSMLVGLLK